MSLVLAVVMAGCAVPGARPAAPGLSALGALREVEQALGLTPQDSGLMAITGIEAYEPGPQGTVLAGSSWVYTFFDSMTSTVRHVKWSGTYITEDYTLPSFGNFATLSPSIGAITMDSTDVAQNVSLLAAAPPSLETENRYWLNALAGYPIWTAVQTTPNVAPSAFAFNANTGTALSVGTLPHLTGLSMKANRAVAETAVLVAAQDAHVVTVAAVEGEIRNTGDELFADVFHYGYIPVGDILPGDGLAPYWAYLFYSPGQEQLWPVFVYANSVTLVGNPIPAPGSHIVYGREVPDDIMDPLDLVHHFKGNMTWSAYRYFNPGITWRITYGMPWGEASGIFDAITGEVRKCYPCD